jgi:GTP-binding protein Era
MDSPEYRSGFIGVMGRPNVGKSTLLNRLLQQTIAAVSPKPQTTRLQQLGILTNSRAQLIFIDTPGLHHPQHKLGEYMNQDAIKALQDVDLAMLILDATTSPVEEDLLFAKALNELRKKPPVLKVLNKLDLVSPDQLAGRQAEYEAIDPPAPLIAVSAASGKNCDLLLEKLIEMLPPGPPLYPEDQITDLYERDIAADLIRAAAMNLLDKELPHVIAVRIDEYKERGEDGAYIGATIFTERESQKAILIGEGGQMIKNIGTAARKEIERMSSRKVFLKLRVKVKKNWRNDEGILQLFGFKK